MRGLTAVRVAAVALVVAALAVTALVVSGPRPASRATARGTYIAGNGGGGRGGTIMYLQYKESEHLDPQRLSVRRDLANLGRLAYRSLVALPSSSDAKGADTPVPDLATTTGTHNADDTVWSFTLKQGLRWQDGRTITCADLRYGVSRTFATDVITGGPTYALTYLDIPVDHTTHRPIYTGPYHSTVAGRRAFDRAVTCAGSTITYRFKKPWLDFPLAIASLSSFDPYRRDLDQGDKSNLTIISDGPYEMTGTYSHVGYVMVRNRFWNASTDPVRKAYPDRFVFKLGMDPDTQYDQLIADQLPDAVTVSTIPPADFGRITAAVAQRATLVDSPFTDYLRFSFGSPVTRNPQVRRALAQATDRRGWSSALGGRRVSVPAYSIVNPATPGYVRNPAFAQLPTAGEVGKARETLTSSGLKLPVPITFYYAGGTLESENAAVALKRSWDAAGFKVTLNEPGLGYCVVQDGCRVRYDVELADSEADWPSIGTVLPPVFGRRSNAGRSVDGFVFDNSFENGYVDRRIDAISAITDRARADAAWGRLDATLGEETAYVPLDVSRSYLLRGSNVGGYATPASTGHYPDLAVIRLEDPTIG